MSEIFITQRFSVIKSVLFPVDKVSAYIDFAALVTIELLRFIQMLHV